VVVTHGTTAAPCDMEAIAYGRVRNVLAALGGKPARIAPMTAISANKVKIGNLVSRGRIRARAIVV
jgi:hypothetical protein